MRQFKQYGTGYRIASARNSTDLFEMAIPKHYPLHKFLDFSKAFPSEEIDWTRYYLKFFAWTQSLICFHEICYLVDEKGRHQSSMISKKLYDFFSAIRKGSLKHESILLLLFRSDNEF